MCSNYHESYLSNISKKIYRVWILFQYSLCILRMIANSLRNTMGSVYLKDDYCIIASKFCITACVNDFFFRKNILKAPWTFIYHSNEQKHFFWCQVSIKSVFGKKKKKKSSHYSKKDFNRKLYNGSGRGCSEIMKMYRTSSNLKQRWQLISKAE